jgi:hypothetical protein
LASQLVKDRPSTFRSGCAGRCRICHKLAQKIRTSTAVEAIVTRFRISAVWATDNEKQAQFEPDQPAPDRPCAASPSPVGCGVFNHQALTINQVSHFTEIKTQIKDIEALRLACAELGVSLVPNTSARGYSDTATKGDYVIRLKGLYDIALNKQADGTYGLTADLWQGRVEQEVGSKYGKLLQLYGVHKATLEARRKGLSVLRRPQPNGSIKRVLMGVGA